MSNEKLFVKRWFSTSNPDHDALPELVEATEADLLEYFADHEGTLTWSSKVTDHKWIQKIKELIEKHRTDHFESAGIPIEELAELIGEVPTGKKLLEAEQSEVLQSRGDAKQIESIIPDEGNNSSVAKSLDKKKRYPLAHEPNCTTCKFLSGKKDYCTKMSLVLEIDMLEHYWCGWYEVSGPGESADSLVRRSSASSGKQVSQGGDVPVKVQTSAPKNGVLKPAQKNKKGDTKK